MHRFKRTCGVLMAGALTISAFAVTGCRTGGRMRDDPQTDVSLNTSETTSEPYGPSQTETSDITYQCPSSPAKAAKALAQLHNVKGSELHSSVILSSVDINTLRELGINVTCEPKFETQKLYNT